MPGKVPIILHSTISITSSAPPPIEVRRRVAIGAADRRLVHETHAAPILQAGIGQFAAQPAGFQFRHGRKPRHVLAGDQSLRGAIDQRTQQLDLGLHFRELEVDHLVVENELPNALRLRVYSMVSAMMNSCALRQAAAPHSRSSWNWIIW